MAKIRITSPVDGSVCHYPQLCALMRDSSQPCGPDATLLEAQQ
jgi:hypothetical protein